MALFAVPKGVISANYIMFMSLFDHTVKHVKVFFFSQGTSEHAAAVAFVDAKEIENVWVIRILLAYLELVHA